MQEIKSIDFLRNEIVVLDNLSKLETAKMTNADEGIPTEIYKQKGSVQKALVFLTCNVNDVVHYKY